MTFKKLLALALVSSLLSVNVVFAEDSAEDISGSEDFDTLNVKIDGKEVGEKEEVSEDVEKLEKENSKEAEDVCGFDVPEEKTYKSQVVAVRRQLRVEPGEEYRVKVFIKNTGNMPWFSNESVCLGPKISLGTDKERDHESELHEEGLDGWEAANRVAMDQYRTSPGEIASFTFWGKASDEPDVYKQFFTPVASGIQWLDDGQFSFDIIVGDTGENAADVREKLTYANFSGSVSDLDLNAEKTLLVDLSEQKLYVKLGDFVVREFLVSTGAAATPTPVGETSITLKQYVRVGAKKPHYIMPRFMMFRAGGYGFHALPSLGNDGGVFWTEARNHIGIPVSHGCVRVLPEDADWIYDFADIGTTVIVQK